MGSDRGRGRAVRFEVVDTLLHLAGVTLYNPTGFGLEEFTSNQVIFGIKNDVACCKYTNIANRDTSNTA